MDEQRKRVPWGVIVVCGLLFLGAYTAAYLTMVRRFDRRMISSVQWIDDGHHGDMYMPY